MNYEGNNNQQWCQRIAFSEKAKLLIHNFLNARLAMYWELYENNYSTAYEQLISLMIQRFKLLFQKGQEKKLITNYYFLFQLIIPYFATQPQFNYQQFLQLNDETFNLIIDKFQQADDPTLRSLAYLFHGKIDQSQHCLLRVDRKTANFLQQQYTTFFHQKKYDERVVLELMENGPVKLYNQKEQLLIYDQPQNLVLNG